MSETDELLKRNRAYAERFGHSEAPAQPALGVAVVSCMDARFHVSKVLGLREGDAHIIRNAGGVVTDDVIRSLAISQRLLGTRSVIVIHHTGCGMTTFSDDAFRRELEQETGVRPPWAAEAFQDADAEALQSLARLRSSPFLLHQEDLRAFVYDVATGLLREVS